MESVLTLRVSAKTKSQREKLAAATNRSKSFLASEALERYLELEAWQIKEIKQALKEPVTDNLTLSGILTSRDFRFNDVRHFIGKSNTKLLSGSHDESKIGSTGFNPAPTSNITSN